MISTVIPTLEAAATLPRCLEALGPARRTGLVQEIVVTDGGSTDATRAIAEGAGAQFIAGAKGRGAQLRRGAEAAKGRWLLFLHADTVLEATWTEEVACVVAGPASSVDSPRASDPPLSPPFQGGGFHREGGESGLQKARSVAPLEKGGGGGDQVRDRRAFVFTLAFDDAGALPLLVAAGAMLRTRVFAAPYGDQGLLLPRALYDALGGYRELPLFEDVDLVDRVVKRCGRRALKVLKSRATTSAARYRKDGWLPRVAKNFACLSLYRAGVPPERIRALYET